MGKDSKQESRWSPNTDKETKVEILAPDMGNAQIHKTGMQKTIVKEQKEVNQDSQDPGEGEPNINLWRNLYTKICIESSDNNFAAVEALKPENKQFNRYQEVYPYDHSRVPLTNVPATNYINASLVLVEKVERKYILTQGPLAGTTPHFWSMVWEQQSKAVVMLNRVMEKGTLKCHQYWPTNKGDTVKFDDVGLSVENTKTNLGQHYNITTIRITKTETNESRDVLHFHYTTWPDFGVPACPDTFLEFLRAIRESGSMDKGVGPAVIHCSAGIGRSGTFILVDSCLREAEISGQGVVRIKQRLLDMRTYRMGLIQSEEQLRFSYQSIIEGIRQSGLRNNATVFETSAQEVSDSSSENETLSPLPPPKTESIKEDGSQEKERVIHKEEGGSNRIERSLPNTMSLPRVRSSAIVPQTKST